MKFFTHYNMSKKYYLISFILLFFLKPPAFSHGDEDVRKLFIREWGFTVLLDYYQNPVYRYTYDMGYGLDTGYYKDIGFGLASVQYGFRHNIHCFSDEWALSVSATPCVALGPWTGDFDGFGILNIPVLLSFDGGAGATDYSVSDNGFFIGAGVEVCKTPIVFLFNSWLYNGEKKKSLWMEPVFSAGFRKWRSSSFSSEEHLHTLGIKIGIGELRPYRKSELAPMTESRSLSFRIYFSTFIDYQ